MHLSSRFAPFTALLFLLASCTHDGLAPGATCTTAEQCASNLCLTQSSLGLGSTGVCVSRCASTADCTGGQICGTFNYGGVYADSGIVSTDPSEIVMVCRPRLNPICSASAACSTAGQVCLGAPGVCTVPCALDADCESTLCVPAAGTCGAGACAPLCDDTLECPAQWYCNLVGAPTTPHGRCEPISGSGQADAACSSGLDASQ